MHIIHILFKTGKLKCPKTKQTHKNPPNMTSSSALCATPEKLLH